MLNAVDHIDIRTPDFEGAVAFLGRLGLVEVRRTDPERGSVEMALPGTNQVVFEIRRDPEAEKTYVHHVAFKVDDPATAVEGLQDNGVQFTKTLALIQHTGRTISNTQDPGGMVWQLSD